jgi:hypothetical protein
MHQNWNKQKEEKIEDFGMFELHSNFSLLREVFFRKATEFYVSKILLFIL